MRLWLVVGLVAAACLLPAAGSRIIRRGGTPKQMIAFSIASLVAMTAAVIVGLGAIVDPGALPVRDLPVFLGRCIDAAGRILEHPVRQWPRIVAAVLLVTAVLRLLWSCVATVRDARSLTRVVDAIGLHAPSVDGNDMDVLVVPADEPFAFTVGLRRRRIVVSEPVLTRLGLREREAVLAHERAHVQAWHAALLTVGAVLSRAFPFISPLRVSAGQLLAGLEMAADEVAARTLGDPLVVARTLLALAPHAPPGRMHLGVAESGIADRVERLTKAGIAPPLLSRLAAGAVLLSMVCLALVLLLALPASAGALSDDGRAIAIHAACHLPHIP